MRFLPALEGELCSDGAEQEDSPLLVIVRDLIGPENFQVLRRAL